MSQIETRMGEVNVPVYPFICIEKFSDPLGPADSCTNLTVIPSR